MDLGRRLLRLPEASELLGRSVLAAGWDLGCDDLRSPRAEVDDCALDRSLFIILCELGPGEEMRSLKPNLEVLFLVGVPSCIGEDVASLESGLLIGSLDSREAGPKDDPERGEAEEFW